jgi:hypothetical protein
VCGDGIFAPGFFITAVVSGFTPVDIHCSQNLPVCGVKNFVAEFFQKRRAMFFGQLSKICQVPPYKILWPV